MNLNRDKFLRWLQSKLPFASVGSPSDCHVCPLATFYCEVTGGHEVVIADDMSGHYCIDRGYDKRRLPIWAHRFARGVDREGGKRISAQRAIEILATC